MFGFAVIGPNGSGKSAILDALQFLLGNNSKKELRGVLDQLINDQVREEVNYLDTSLLRRSPALVFAWDRVEIKLGFV